MIRSFGIELYTLTAMQRDCHISLRFRKTRVAIRGACTCTAAPRRRCAQTPCTERAARMCLGKRRRSGSAKSIPIVFARGTRRPLHFFSLRRQTREAFSSREPGLYHLPCHTKLSGRISSCSCSSKGVTGLQQKQPPRAAHILTHMVSHTITTMN